MLYIEFMIKAKDLTIITDDTSGNTFLRPDYRKELINNGLKTSDVTDWPEFSDELMAEELKLEVTMRNAKNDKIPCVAEWIHEIITTAVTPALIDEQNELVKNVVDYMQFNDKLQDKEKELTKKEETLEQKENVVQLIPNGMNFAKKKP